MDYGSKRWRKLRAQFLRTNPLCVMCSPRVEPATVVDHKIPHKDDPGLMWDWENLQGLCATHHNSTKQRYEKTGRVIGCDESGFPLSPSHHWHK